MRNDNYRIAEHKDRREIGYDRRVYSCLENSIIQQIRYVHGKDQSENGEQYMHAYVGPLKIVAYHRLKG